MTTATASKPLFKQLYIQVLIAIALGAVIGAYFPHFSTNDWIKSLGEGFVKLIKMMIAPIIFCTCCFRHRPHSRRQAGRPGRHSRSGLLRGGVHFALAIGLIVGNLLRPGEGFSSTDANAEAVAKFAKQAQEMKPVEFVMGIIPDSMVGAFAKGDILQVLLVAILFGFSLMALSERGHAVRSFIDDITHAVFGVINIIMKAAPLGAFGAMAYTVGKYGTGVLGNLAGLIATFYLTALLFIIVVLGIIARIAGFNIFKFIAYIKDELLLVVGTSSSESALPQLMGKSRLKID